MAFDFLKNMMMSMDDERFAKICDAMEDAIRELEEDEENFTDLEIMQALDFVGFDLFRDDWEEFKKMDMVRDYLPRNSDQSSNLIN